MIRLAVAGVLMVYLILFICRLLASSIRLVSKYDK